MLAFLDSYTWVIIFIYCIYVGLRFLKSNTLTLSYRIGSIGAILLGLSAIEELLFGHLKNKYRGYFGGIVLIITITSFLVGYYNTLDEEKDIKKRKKEYIKFYFMALYWSLIVGVIVYFMLIK